MASQQSIQTSRSQIAIDLGHDIARLKGSNEKFTKASLTAEHLQTQNQPQTKENA